MKILVGYKSKTAFTKRYAEVIAEDVAASVMDLKDITLDILNEYDIFVYGGGIYAGMINGLKQAKELFAKSNVNEMVVFATGGTPNEAIGEVLDNIWNTNLTPEELEKIARFYMQGGIDYSTMKLADKMIMKMLSSMLAKQKNKSEFDAGMAERIKNSYDGFSKEYAMPLIDYLKKK